MRRRRVNPSSTCSSIPICCCAASRTIPSISRFEKPNAVLPGQYRVDVLVNGNWRGPRSWNSATSARMARRLVTPSNCCAVRGSTWKSLSARLPSRGVRRWRHALLRRSGYPCSRRTGQVRRGGTAIAVDRAHHLPEYETRQHLCGSGLVGQWHHCRAAGLYRQLLFAVRARRTFRRPRLPGLERRAERRLWRVRHDGSVAWGSREGLRYQRGRLYAVTGIPSWKSELLGETSSDGRYFDPVSFRGARGQRRTHAARRAAQLRADHTRHRPDQCHGQSHQRGFLVHETTVAAGPFVIEDLQAASYGGDLEVRIVEANGETRRFTVPSPRPSNC